MNVIPLIKLFDDDDDDDEVVARPSVGPDFSRKRAAREPLVPKVRKGTKVYESLDFQKKS